MEGEKSSGELQRSVCSSPLGTGEIRIGAQVDRCSGALIASPGNHMLPRSRPAAIRPQRYAANGPSRSDRPALAYRHLGGIG